MGIGSIYRKGNQGYVKVLCPARIDTPWPLLLQLCVYMRMHVHLRVCVYTYHAKRISIADKLQAYFSVDWVLFKPVFAYHGSSAGILIHSHSRVLLNP